MQTRLTSLDAFRGFTMIWMFSQSFGLHLFKDDPLFGPIARQFTHHDWHGAYAWDMIQPFFMFIVGVAMPFAFAAREERGESFGHQFKHVLKRAALLILLGLFARSLRANKPVLDLINVLAQIAFTYVAAFLVMRYSARLQGAVAFALLALHTALFLSRCWRCTRRCFFSASRRTRPTPGCATTTTGRALTCGCSAKRGAAGMPRSIACRRPRTRFSA